MPEDTERLAEVSLGPQAEAEWLRLRRQIDLSEGFWLGFLFCHSPLAGHVFAERLQAVFRSHARSVTFLRSCRTFWNLYSPTAHGGRTGFVWEERATHLPPPAFPGNPRGSDSSCG